MEACKRRKGGPMPRNGRILIDHACYHVVTRGNQKQAVFFENEDYERYLLMTKRAKKRYDVSIYAYCLMPNHIHFLLYVEVKDELSKFMHWLNRGYAAYFNAKQNKVGHVWQGRFKSRPIIKGRYLLHVAEYIEANPVRAKLVADIADYRWSSYRERCLLAKKDVTDDIEIDRPGSREGTGLISKMGTL